MKRKARKDEPIMVDNPAIEIIPVVTQDSWCAEIPIPIEVRLICHSPQSLSDLQIRWRAAAWGAEGTLPVPDGLPAGEKTLGYAILPPMKVNSETSQKVSFEIRNRSGQVLSKVIIELRLTKNPDCTNVL
jgi:hypothetical protein